MSSLSRFQQAVGIRADETQTVGLFFVHNVLLGIGTILVYVAANVILLENHPETSLPLAYLASAAGMIGVGQLYAYYEHHLGLRNLTLRVLGSVAALTVVLGVLVYAGHSVAAAVAIMVGFRVIYLLTNLEFWGVSSVVFDTRQSKRLFSVISAGDMPAKALGAILAALVHAHATLLLLLLVAFAAFLGAFFTLRRTFQAHSVQHAHRRRAVREQPALLRKLSGGNRLVLLMGLSLLLLAAVGIEIEYGFFINVKHKFHDQSDVIQVVGYVLAATYLVAMLVKLLVSRQAVDRFGIGRTLLALPVTGLLGLVVVLFFDAFGTSETRLLVLFCGLYLTFEVVRRAVFDPVFLVLFQPLSPAQRLEGHTLVKGLYEPLGLGLAGGVIYLLHGASAFEGWVPLVWLGFLALALWLLRRTYRHYLGELQEALGNRFLENGQLALPGEALKLVTAHLQSTRPDEVVTAIGWLQQQQPAALGPYLPALLDHPAAAVRRRALEAAEATALSLRTEILYQRTFNDDTPDIRQTAARLLGRRADTELARLPELLLHTDISIRTGAIHGLLDIHPGSPEALQSLQTLTKRPDAASRLAALDVIREKRLAAFTPFVKTALASPDATERRAALQAAGVLPDPDLTWYLIERLPDPALGRAALASLKAQGPAALPLLQEAVRRSADPRLARRVAALVGTWRVPESRTLLLDLLRRPDRFVQEATLRALAGVPVQEADAPLFRQVLRDELLLAQRLLHGTDGASPAWAAALDYELTVLRQRIFGILRQLVEPAPIERARLGLDHPQRERRANALELLDNLIPRPVYQVLQALTDAVPLTERLALIDTALGPLAVSGTLTDFVITQGQAGFSDWTLSLALRQWVPTDGPTAHVVPYLTHPEPLLRESAAQAVARLSPRPEAAGTPSSSFPPAPSMTAPASAVSALERVVMLKNTQLFAQTPENVLTSITPIMREVTHDPEAVIFEKGELGTCLYLIHAGEVGIYDGPQELARFGPGDFFGELALLDTEARSATARAETAVRLFRIDQDDFYELMEERGEVLRAIVRTLCGRIRNQNSVLAAQRADITRTTEPAL
jgi:HEAT repeat protein